MKIGTIKSLLKKSDCYIILDLIGHDGIIESSSENNYCVVKRDPFTKVDNFPWLDFKEFFSDNSNTFHGIRNWHFISIEQNNDYVRVGTYENEHLRNVKVKLDKCKSDINEIEVNGLSDDRKEQLKYFNNFVDNKGKTLIFDNY